MSNSVALLFYSSSSGEKMLIVVLLVVVGLCCVSCNEEENSVIIQEDSVGNRKTNFNAGNERIILEQMRMETPDFVRYHGYPCETHEVTTEDDYILNIHRVPHGRERNPKRNNSKPIVLLQHGIFSYSGDWFTSGPQKSLGFILADEGYDVWVGNARGNKYSRKHHHISPNNESFWDFSWHEIGYYDLPAMIDHILNHTSAEKLFYVGHSQGTTSYYVLLSERPEYNEKITAQYSLAPVAYMTHLYGPGLTFLKSIENILELSADLLGVHELTYENPIFKFFTRKFCTINFIKELCVEEIFTFTGHDMQQFNVSLLPMIIANFPAGSSLKQLKHYAQEIKSGEFQHYDHGFLKNEVLYGSFFPPNYNISNIQAPIHLFYSTNDYLSSPTDVLRFFTELPEGNKYSQKVANSKWNHIDYLWGMDAKTYVYNHILKSMRDYRLEES